MCIASFIWLIIAILFLLFELGHPGLFYFLSFACGALAALILSLFDFALLDQAVLFFIVSSCATVLLRKWVRRYGNRGHFLSNVYAMRGKQGIVVTPWEKSLFAGYMHIEGQVWAYKPLHEEVIPAGETVEVVDVHGAHLVVKRVE